MATNHTVLDHTAHTYPIGLLALAQHRAREMKNRFELAASLLAPLLASIRPDSLEWTVRESKFLDPITRGYAGNF